MRKYSQAIVVVLLLMLPLGLLQFQANAQQTTNSNHTAKPRADIGLKIFDLAHADASDLIQTINPLFSIDANARVVAVCDKRTNTIIARGPDSELELLEVVLKRLDEPTAKPK